MVAQKQQITITRTTGTGSYASGFVINNSGSNNMLNFSFSDSLTNSPKFLMGGVIASSNSASSNSTMYLLLFNSTFSIAADSASFNPTITQLGNFMGSVTFDTWTSLSQSKFSEGKCVKPTVVDPGNIYGVLISSGSYVPISQEQLIVKIDLENQ